MSFLQEIQLYCLFVLWVLGCVWVAVCRAAHVSLEPALAGQEQAQAQAAPEVGRQLEDGK